MSSSGLIAIVLKHDPPVSSGFSCVYKKPEEMTTRGAEKRKRDAEQAEMIPDDPVDEERGQKGAGPSTGWGAPPRRGGSRGGRGGGRVARMGEGVAKDAASTVQVGAPGGKLVPRKKMTRVI
jgi:hypothetical protein